MTTVLFSAFKEACEDKGYTRIYEDRGVFVLYTNNNVKSEIKKKHFTLGWTRLPSEVNLIRETLTEQGFNVSDKQRGDVNKCVNVLFNKTQDVLEQFFAVVDVIENIEGITARERGSAKKVFSREVAETNIFEKIAKTYQFAIDNEHQLLLDQGRQLLEADTIDHILCRGESVRYEADNGWREHIVPCILIHNEAIRMVQENCSVAEIAQMIATNLAIVRIHKDEAYKLDVELGLRTSMPENWKFGDNVFARLKFAGIDLK
jgi:hypothetical protein